MAAKGLAISVVVVFVVVATNSRWGELSLSYFEGFRDVFLVAVGDDAAAAAAGASGVTLVPRGGCGPVGCGVVVVVLCETRNGEGEEALELSFFEPDEEAEDPLALGLTTKDHRLVCRVVLVVVAPAWRVLEVAPRLDARLAETAGVIMSKTRPCQ